MPRELPVFLHDLIDSPPRAGEGVHPWMFRVSRQLHAHMPALEIVALLETRTARCGRHVPRAEIIAAVQNSVDCAWHPTGRNSAHIAPAHRRWPPLNERARREIIADGSGLAELWETSPHRIEDNGSHAEEFIDVLFPDNPLLCCGKSNHEFDTRSREEWRGSLARLALIVPSPMTARIGKTKDGKDSAHALSITGPRRFLVVEQDKGTEDEQAAVLLHLAAHAPLALAVHSGGKSIHGWFYCAGQLEDRLDRFMRYAVSIGGDSAGWSPCQFERMPDGTRDNGRRQTVFYFNPLVIKP